MINLPLLHSLDVTAYGLYPGRDPVNPGMRIHFNPGLTLVLGANGLGKTTLTTMLYRLLTGPNEIPVLLQDTDLGTASLEARPLRRTVQYSFAHRVADGAVHATARLEFDVGGQRVSVERNLRNLTLRSFKVGESAPSTIEHEYQSEMIKLANVSSFGDWILLLRYIVFYFEDRRSLVWDPSAQRQLLRILFLDPDRARGWTELEREILEADTEVRNLRAVVNRQERQLVSDESLFRAEPEIRRELEEQEDYLLGARTSFDELMSQLPDIEVQHELARLNFLKLEQERESLFRELEGAQFFIISSHLPSYADSLQYIFASLFSESRCLVCENSDPGIRDSLESRILGGECIVCGSDFVPQMDDRPVDLARERVAHIERRLQATDVELESTRSALEAFEAERNEAVVKIQELQTAIAEGKAKADNLLRRLPPEESEIHERRQEFASLRARVEILLANLEERRLAFGRVVAEANNVVVENSQEVQRIFGYYAQQFLFERCNLVWAPLPAQLGQTGDRIAFPAFGLELGGSDFSGTRRRSGPDDVSESQREFIDISFRMALASVATQDHVTSLVMDAPESSLDVVFVDKAADVLSAFGHTEAGNRLVVTSNLIDGNLIPKLLGQATNRDDGAERVVDLLTIAAPTAAIESLRDQYNTARDRLLAKANSMRGQ